MNARYLSVAGPLLALLLVGAAQAARQVEDPVLKPAAAVQDQWVAPWFCHDLDCPRYTVTKNLTDLGVELRSYEAGKWAATTISGVKYDRAVTTGFWRLFKYISGANNVQQKVAMTAPVTVGVSPGAGPFCEDNYTVAFFVPYQYQETPPVPSAPEVQIIDVPAHDVYVYSFSGFAIGSTYLEKASAITQQLEQAAEEVDTSMFFTAGYDAPFKLTNRHNEVHLLAKKQPTGVATSN